MLGKHNFATHPPANRVNIPAEPEQHLGTVESQLGRPKNVASSEGSRHRIAAFRGMKELGEIKVVLQSPEGKYLAGSGMNPCLVEEKARAIVLDYFADQVEYKIKVILEHSGIEFRPVALPPGDVYEVCDGCQRLEMPRETFFDGRLFLCAACKAEADAKLRADRLAA